MRSNVGPALLLSTIPRIWVLAAWAMAGITGLILVTTLKRDDPAQTITEVDSAAWGPGCRYGSVVGP